MNTIAILFNGLRLPYHLVNHAIARAKQQSSSILAVFLTGSDKPGGGYLFPSDLPLADNQFFADKTASDNDRMLADNMRLVQQMVENEGINYKGVSNTDASIDSIAGLTGEASLLLVSDDFDEAVLDGNSKITLQGLQEETGKPVEVVHDNLG